MIFMRQRSAPGVSGRRKGFALVTVIWGLSLISVLIISFMSGARLRLQTAYNIAGSAKVNFLAYAAIDSEMLSLMEGQSAGPRSAQGTQAGSFAARASGAGRAQRTIQAGQPRVCALDGAAVIIAVEEEGGKVDLNAAPQELIKAALIGFGAARREADALAKAIVAFRSAAIEQSAQAASDGGPGPKKAPFQTIYELDQIPGLQGQILRDLIPFVTVYSRHPGVDAETAPPALFAALAGLAAEDVLALVRNPYPNALDRADPRFPAAFKQNGDSGVVLIHVEARLATGHGSVLEAVVDTHAGGVSGVGEPFAVRELRRNAPARYAEALRSALNDGGAPGC